jgi:hypothetical protein
VRPLRSERSALGPLSYGELLVRRRQGSNLHPSGFVDRRLFHSATSTWCYGLTRVVGREGIEPPLSIDGCFTGSCAPWRDRPNFGAERYGPDVDASAVVKELVSGLAIRRFARSEGVEPPAVGVGDRGAAVARAQ